MEADMLRSRYCDRLMIAERFTAHCWRVPQPAIRWRSPSGYWRSRLRIRAAAGVRTGGQALVHLLMLAGPRGIAVRGPMIGREHAYVPVRGWLGEPRPFERDRALAELARRYLAGHGPADDSDLAKWAGLTVRDARAGLAAISSELTTDIDGQVNLARHPHAAGLPSPRLLGAFGSLSPEDAIALEIDAKDVVRYLAA